MGNECESRKQYQTVCRHVEFYPTFLLVKILQITFPFDCIQTFGCKLCIVNGLRVKLRTLLVKKTPTISRCLYGRLSPHNLSVPYFVRSLDSEAQTLLSCVVYRRDSCSGCYDTYETYLS